MPSNSMPTVRIQKNVPNSSNLIHNKVGNERDQKIRQAKNQFHQKKENEFEQVKARLGQKIQKTKVDIYA